MPWVFGQICLAVQVLHDQLIAHRDIKVDNILLKSDPESSAPSVKLCDFTIAVQLEHKE